MQTFKHQNLFLRGGSALVMASLALPMLGCGSRAPQQTTQNQPQANSGLSTKQKVVLLAGAAALYYVYNRYKKQNEAALAGKNVQYYLSKNGRVYYRDPQTKQAIWVTPPPQNQSAISVPADQASAYNGFQGYENAPSGKTLGDVFETR